MHPHCQSFIDQFREGHEEAALEALIPTLHLPLDQEPPYEGVERTVLHFADSCFFAPPLHSCILAEELLKQDLGAFSQTLQRLLPSYRYAAGKSDTESDLTPAFTQLLAERSGERALLASKSDPRAQWSRNHLRAIYAAPRWSCCLPFTHKPLYARKSLPSEKVEKAVIKRLAQEDAERPLLLLADSQSWDWSALCSTRAAATFALFPEVFSYFQSLQSDAFVSLMELGMLTPLIATSPLLEQWRALGSPSWPDDIVPCIALAEDPWSRENAGGIGSCWTEAVAALRDGAVEGEALNRFDDAGKRLAYYRSLARFGPSRFWASWSREAVNRFFQEGARQDPIHPLVTSPPCPLTAEALPAPAVQTKRRAPRPEKPWRIAHLFHTLIDQAHAPTKLLKLLLEHCDRQAFEPYVYVSEGSLIRPKEYPLHAFTAERSQSWGHDTCEFLAEHAITLRDMGDPSQSYTEQAAAIQAQLEEDEIDLLIAHIPNAVSKLLMQHSCVPRWVYFDHAGPFLKPEQAQRQRPHYFQLPTEDEYDALVLCEPKDAEIQRFYAERSIAIHSLPYAISARPRVPALERATLDIASSAKVFTTLSLFLQERLSPPCTEAIVEILKRCSDSHYLLIGPCGPKPPFMERFEAAGVAERVHCVGMQEEPGPFLGMADIYLNEFPEGSGLALIEAMGYGLPLVSLDDPSGPPQRRFASLYYGAEYSVNTVEGYIERACQLAQEPKTYAAARSAALEAYAQHSNAGRYVKDFEAVLLKQLSTPH